jgi:hypothetical protein
MKLGCLQRFKKLKFALMSQTVNLNFISTKLAEHSSVEPILYQQAHPSCVATIFLQQFL